MTKSSKLREISFHSFMTSIIKSKTLELIAIKIGDLDTGGGIIDFLVECGVDRSLIEYPQTKWRMVYAVLTTLSKSLNQKDHEILFKIIEEASHPLMHNGDEELAKQTESRFNNLLKYDNLTIKRGKLKRIELQSEQDDEYGDYGEEDEEDDVFSYDGGLSRPYENSDAELFILKKILLEHKRRSGAGFLAKELSFNNNSLEEVCEVINKLMEDKILYLAANTRPERDEKKGIDGIEDRRGFINRDLVKKLDENPQEMDKESGYVVFDTEVLDEVKLKGRIDIAIDEFMNDKVFNPLGYMVDKAEVEKMLVQIKQQYSEKERKSLEETLKPKELS